MNKVDPVQFYDDSSRALDLSYSATHVSSASPTDRAMAQPLTREELEQREVQANEYQKFIAPIAEAELAEASGPKATVAPDGTIIPTNAGAYRDFEKRTRELQDEGYSLVDAQRVARSEIPIDADPSNPQRADYLGDSVESLMSRKVGGGGGGGGSKSKERMFPKRCIYLECALQFCDHPKAAGKGGRPWIFDEPKTQRRDGMRMTKTAAMGLDKAGLSVGDAIQILGVALLEGRTFEDVLSQRLETPAA